MPLDCYLLCSQVLYLSLSLTCSTRNLVTRSLVYCLKIFQRAFGFIVLEIWVLLSGVELNDREETRSAIIWETGRFLM